MDLGRALPAVAAAGRGVAEDEVEGLHGRLVPAVALTAPADLPPLIGGTLDDCETTVALSREIDGERAPCHMMIVYGLI